MKNADMNSPKSADFLVIGAGIAGASVAASLATRGSVVVLDAEEHAGYHTTGRSAALYSAIYGNGTIRALTRASRSFLFAPPDGFVSTPLVRPRPTLYFARSGKAHLLNIFRADADIAAATDLISASAARALVPVFKPGFVEAAAIEHESADIDVDALLQGFLRQTRQRGGQLLLGNGVQSIRRSDGRWVVRAGDHEIAAPVLVNASGAWGDEVAKLCGVRPVGLQPRRRTALLIETPQSLDSTNWPAAIDIEEQFYFKPDAGLLLLSPADEHLSAPCDAQPEELDIAIAVDRFEQATDVSVRQVKRSWAGLRVFSPDRTPVVGFDPKVPGFFWLVGQGGYGIQTSAAMARVAAALASGEPWPADIAAMGATADMVSPDRFSR
jgi:D-arginine dehydrogenase